MPNNELPKRIPRRRTDSPNTLPDGYPADIAEPLHKALLKHASSTAPGPVVVPIAIVFVGAEYRWIS